MKIKLFTAGLLILMAGNLALPSNAWSADPAPHEVTKTDKCQVCGMFVAKYGEWIAQILFKDGSYVAFDGPKDMFKYYRNPGRYNPGRKQADMQAVYVTEYYSTRLMDAKNLFYVSGSDVLGPMGNELIPLESQQKAKEFLKDHRGKRILKFQEAAKEVLE